MPGVVSIQHGWGHALSMTKTRIASEYAGVNTNILSNEVEVDPLSGNAVLNGIPVTVEKVVNEESESGRVNRATARIALVSFFCSIYSM